MYNILYTLIEYEIQKTEEFERWYEKETIKVQLQIDGRLQRIIEGNHFGHTGQLNSITTELKFNNGNRIYYTVHRNKIIILLIGGNKHTQKKDIQKAKKLARLIHE